MESANSGTAAEAKSYSGKKFRLVAGGDSPEPIGDFEPDSWQDPRKSEAFEYGSATGTVLRESSHPGAEVV